MISGMFPAGLKPGFKLCNDGQCLNGFAAMLWGPIRTRGNLTGSVAKMRPAAKAPKSKDRNNGGGKDMGSTRQDYGFCRSCCCCCCVIQPMERMPLIPRNSMRISEIPGRAIMRNWEHCFAGGISKPRWLCHGISRKSHSTPP
jgi:hypothetical protein